MHDNPPSVSDHFTETTNDQQRPEKPCFVAESEESVYDGEDCKIGAEESICAQTWVVAVNRVFHRALERYGIAVVS